MGKPGNPYGNGKHGYFNKRPFNIQEEFDRKEAQISQSKAEVVERTNGDFIKRSTQQAQNIYTAISKKCVDDRSILERLNIDNPEEAVKYTKELLQSLKLSTDKPACYVVAGAISAMMDNAGVEYSCILGNCEPKSIKKKSPSVINHVWVESRGQIYESFPGHKNSDLGEHTSYYVINFVK